VPVLIAFRNEKLRDAVLKRTDSSIEQSTAFSAVAEEFGNAASGEGGLDSVVDPVVKNIHRSA
jgi:hypothetical protein